VIQARAWAVKWFQSFQTFKMFQSLNISERSNRSVVVQFDFNAASM
jgi:hypothetical protein